MTRLIPILAIAIFCMAGTAYALYSVSDKGDWPTSWPKELDAFRKQSRTLVGPLAAHQHFAIPFANRNEAETAWPHLLKVKGKGTPIFLVRGPNFFLGEKTKVGVVVHAPPVRAANEPAVPEEIIPHQQNPRMTWLNTTYLELVVDGEIVDLNRLQLPQDAPIIDERFNQK